MRSVKGAPEGGRIGHADEGPPVAISDNIFADLGLPDAEDYNARVQLALAVRRLIKERGITQKEAALQVGVKPSDLSNIVNGRLDGISMERLTNVLNHLGQDVEITIRPKREGRARTSVRSSGGTSALPMVASGRDAT